MRRRLISYVLLFVVFWHSLAVAGQTVSLAYPLEPTHALLHWQGESHHHHDDGSFHHDDSEESSQHMATDGCQNSVAVISADCQTQPLLQAAMPAIVDQAAVPPPFLEGIRRPPR